MSRHKMLFTLITTVFLFAACTTSSTVTPLLEPTATPIPASLWGEITTIGQAEQTHAPALWVNTDEIAFAWVGSDEERIHHDFRVQIGDELSSISKLVLPPLSPFGQQLYPAFNQRYHLLWLDQDTDNPGLKLFAATISPTRITELGPNRLSNRQTFHYTAMPNQDNSLVVVWSGGLEAEPDLYVQHIDPAGRPRLPLRLVGNADYPSLIRAKDGSLMLFWMSVTTQVVYRARLVDEQLEDIRPITDKVRLSSGDRLTGFHAGLDKSHGYLFWNIIRMDGPHESWMSSGNLGDDLWERPVRLGIALEEGEPIQTGFNSGHVVPASIGGEWVAWATPLPGQFDILPLAVQVGDALGIAYLQGGEVIGYQRVAQTGKLIGAPAVQTDQNRHLYLAWAQPTSSGYAELKLTMTR